MEYKGFTYTPTPKTAWDNLSMLEKSEMMKVAVRNGITDLKTIKEQYNEFAMGGDKRGRMPAHPRNREKDPEAYDAAQQWRADMQQRRQKQEEQNRVYAEEKAERNARAAEEFNRHKDTVMSALSDIADSVPFTGSEMMDAANAQKQEKIDKWHDIKKGIDATMTAAELAAAGYGVVRGLTHFNRMLARQATQSTGQAIGRDAMQNLLKWNNRVTTIDKPQVLMSGIGSTADAYQWATANNSLDAWENGLETGANAAGVIGGMNWFRNLPYLQRIGGNKIDAVLDGLGYGAAAWDVVKSLPPLSGALENIKQQSGEQKSYGGGIHIKPENRGKFTALKKRTGHSATWFKEHGTPAQKKMAIFALNSRHWKHGLGGPLKGPIVDMAMGSIYYRKEEAK